MDELILIEASNILTGKENIDPHQLFELVHNCSYEKI